jgi:Flp pilus assembly pilin Flp
MCSGENADSKFVISDALRPLLTRFRREASGQDVIEYALLAAMIVLAVVFGITTLSAAIQGRYTTVASQLESGTAAPSDGSASSTGTSSGTSSGSASGTSTPPPSAAASGGSSPTGNSNSGNNGNHAGGGTNGSGRGNAGS